MTDDTGQLVDMTDFGFSTMTTAVSQQLSHAVYRVPTTAATLLNVTNLSEPPGELELIHSDAITAVIVVLMSILTLGTLLGNSLVILAVLQVHKLRSPSNYLILSLAVSDFLVGLIVMPLAMLPEILQAWPLGEKACILYTTSDVMLCTASILTLMMISIDRYLIISKPFKYQRYRTVKLMALYIGLAWSISLLISVTPIFFNWLPETGPNGNLCKVNQKIEYQMYATIGAFYVPIIVMFCVYGRIFYIAWKISKLEKKNHPRASDQPPRTPSYHSSSNSSPMPECKHEHTTNNKKKRRETLSDKLGVSTMAVSSNLSIPLDHKIIDDTILEDESTIDEPPGERDWLRKNEHHNNNHHHQHYGNHNHSNNNHLTPDHHSHRHGSWPLKKLSIVTITSVKRFLTRRKHKGNTHAIKTLGVIMGLFTACWLPFFILAVATPLYCHFYQHLNLQQQSCDPGIPGWVYSAALWLGYANSCFNPLIYARFNREFRTPFREILCFRCHKINESVRHTDYLYQYGEPDQDHHSHHNSHHHV